MDDAEEMDETEEELYWTHDLCGREYTDATREEIALWTSRVACTGFCCDDCQQENEKPLSYDSDERETHA